MPTLGCLVQRLLPSPMWNLTDRALCAQASKAHYAVVKEVGTPVVLRVDYALGFVQARWA